MLSFRKNHDMPMQANVSCQRRIRHRGIFLCRMSFVCAKILVTKSLSLSLHSEGLRQNGGSTTKHQLAKDMLVREYNYRTLRRRSDAEVSDRQGSPQPVSAFRQVQVMWAASGLYATDRAIYASSDNVKRYAPVPHHHSPCDKDL